MAKLNITGSPVEKAFKAAEQEEIDYLREMYEQAVEEMDKAAHMVDVYSAKGPVYAMEMARRTYERSMIRCEVIWQILSRRIES